MVPSVEGYWDVFLHSSCTYTLVNDDAIPIEYPVKTLNNGSVRATSSGEPCISVTEPRAMPSVVPTDADPSPRAGESTTLAVVVAGAGVASVTVNLSAIGGPMAAPMTNAGDGTWTVNTTGTVPSPFADGAYQPALLPVNATSIDGISNTSVAIPLTVVKNGDANEDNRVSLYDAVYVARHAIGIEGYSMTESVGEVSGDGSLSIHDAMYLAKHVLAIPGFEQLH